MQQNKLIITLAAVLLVVVAISVGLLYFIPSEKSSAPSPDISTVSAPVELNDDVLQRLDYKALDLKPVQDGSLPVQPPTGVGKVNPFM